MFSSKTISDDISTSSKETPQGGEPTISSVATTDTHEKQGSDEKHTTDDFQTKSSEMNQSISHKVTRQTLIFVLCAAMNSCNLGFDLGVNSTASNLIQTDMGLSDVQLELFIGSLNWWSIPGSLFAHCSFQTAAIGFIIGLIIMASAYDYTTLMVGRFFVGLGVGFGLAIDPLYISEIAPAEHRGRLVTWAEIGINVGLVLGFCSGLIFYNVDDTLEWRLMFVMGCIMPLLMIVLAQFVMPESPRYLVSKGQTEEAKEILTKLHPEGYDVDPIVRDIQEALERERLAEKTVGWHMIFFPTPAIRRMLIVGVGTAVAQQITGIDAIQYYLIDLLQESGISNDKEQLGLLVGLGVLKLAFIFVGSRLFDKRGRKPLFYVSLTGMMIALILVSLTFLDSTHMGSGWVIGGLALYLSAFSVAMGPGAWLIPSEVFATSIRAKAMSLASFSNRVTAAILSSTFLSLVNAITWGGFFLTLAAICFLVIVFMYFLLPETKGKTLEEMSLYFAEITGDDSILKAEQKILAKRCPTIPVEMEFDSESSDDESELQESSP